MPDLPAPPPPRPPFLLRPLLVLLATVLATACGAQPAELAGRYQGDGLEVELRADAGDGYAGTLTLGGVSYTARATGAGVRLDGTFTDGGERFVFTFTRTADGAALVTGGTTYALRRAAAANPLARPGPAAPANPLAAGGRPDAGDAERVAPEVAAELDAKTTAAEQALASAPAFTKTYRHPAGVYFLHPERWTVRPIAESAVALEPDDAAVVGGQRAELTIVVGEDADGASRVDDPRVAQLVEQFVRESFPYLRRDGGPSTERIGAHTALLVRWRGEVQGTGMRAGMHVALLGGYVLGAFTLAPADRFDARQRTMTDVFRTFGYDEPKGDPRLVGTWRHSKTYVSGSFSTVTVRNLVLLADGTCLEGGKLFAGMEHRGGAGETVGSTIGNAEGADQRGRWRVEGDRIVLEWGGGSERWSFYVEGGSMLWKDGKARKLWERVR